MLECKDEYAATRQASHDSCNASLSVLHVRKDGGDAPGMPSYLREAMARAGLSQAELARKSGTSESQISRWLSGENRPNIEQLRTIAPHLSARLIDLVVMAGHLKPEEVGMEGPPPMPEAPVWSREAIIDLVRSSFRKPAADAIIQTMKFAWAAEDNPGAFRDEGPALPRAARKGIARGRRKHGLDPQSGDGSPTGGPPPFTRLV